MSQKQHKMMYNQKKFYYNLKALVLKDNRGYQEYPSEPARNLNLKTIHLAKLK
jgi:hypothetical protein